MRKTVCVWDWENVDGAYRSLQRSNKHAIENLAGFVRVADILECFCRVLAADVEEYFLTTSAASRQ